MIVPPYLRKYLYIALILLTIRLIIWRLTVADYSYLARIPMRELRLRIGDADVPYKLTFSYTKISLHPQQEKETLIPAKFLYYMNCIKSRFAKYSDMITADFNCLHYKPLRPSVYGLFPIATDFPKLISDITNDRPIQYVRPIQ